MLLRIGQAAPLEVGPVLAEADINCEILGEEKVKKFVVDTPYQAKARLVDLRPDALCRANANATINMLPDFSSKSKEDAKICESMYISAKKAVEDYRAAMVAACNEGKNLDKGCSTDKNPAQCQMLKARAAADANESAAAFLTEARKKMNSLASAAADARETYKKDLADIKEAFRKHKETTEKLRAQGNFVAVEEMEETARNATGLRDGVLVMDGDKLTSGITSRRGNESTITSYRDKIDRAGNGLLSEQDLAHKTGDAFKKQADDEILERRKSASNLRDYASRLEPAAKKQAESIVSGNSSLSGSFNPMSAMAPLAMASGLASQMNKSAGSTSENLVSNASTALPKVSQSKGISTSSLMGASAASSARGELPLSPSKSAGATASWVGGSGNALTGFGDQVDSDAGMSSDVQASDGRSIASDSSSAGKSGDAPVASPGKKKNTEGAAPCKGEKDCIGAIGLETAQFNKGGSLGIPLLGAADPGLGTVGALENLFANPVETTSATTAALGGGLEWSLGNSATESVVSSASTQGATEIGLPSSGTLFQRVRVAHEKALKRGTVLLFHKRL